MLQFANENLSNLSDNVEEEKRKERTIQRSLVVRTKLI